MQIQRTSQKLRGKLFWALDRLKGNQVKRHLDEITDVLENFDSERSRQLRKINLERLLDHATSTTRFYAPYQNHPLSRFPIIDKMDMRKSYDDMLSENYRNKRNYEIATSGTTGIPFVVIQDKNKKARNTADTLYYGNKGGYELGDRLYYLRRWTDENKRTSLDYFLTNIRAINVTDLSDSYLAKNLSKIASDSASKALLGYPSGLSTIIRHMKFSNHAPFEIPFKSIITMSEGISDRSRKDLETYMGAPVISRYSNSENGIFGQQILNEGSDYHLNWASYVIEVLDLYEDKPAEPGQFGRIVITDLFNYAMPMIRYDTGDLGILARKNPYFNKARTLKEIVGRKMDVIFNTRGEPLSAFVAYEMEYYHELKQFQLIQEDKKRYTAKLNIEGAFDKEKAVINRLKKFLGQDAEIEFQYVDKFPELASGKRQLTINNYIPVKAKEEV